MIPVPARLRGLPTWGGYVVPFFVEWFDTEGKPTKASTPGARPDFRVIRTASFGACLRLRSCWICGKPLGRFASFVVGPMCTVNRISSEPPSHLECATYAVRVCPHLTNPAHVRREANFPGPKIEAPGIMLTHNPGASALWTTRAYKPKHATVGRAGVLFDMGEPHSVTWWTEGRQATRVEVLRAVARGIPHLAALCENDDDRAVMARQLERVQPWFPAKEADVA